MRSSRDVAFNDKLTILFDEADCFPVLDSGKQSREAARLPAGGRDSPPSREKPPREDDEPGCLSFTHRRSRAESNPFLKDFFRRLQDRQRAKRSK
jgi:hypothetical protein